MSLESAIKGFTDELKRTNELLAVIAEKGTSPATVVEPSKPQDQPAETADTSVTATSKPAGPGAPPTATKGPGAPSAKGPGSPPAAKTELTGEELNKQLIKICTDHLGGNGEPIFNILRDDFNAASYHDVPQEKWPELLEKVKGLING